MSVSPIRIIGVDPGLRNLGWGVIDCAGSRLSFVACGVVRTNAKEPLSARLLALDQGLEAVLRTHAPHEAAVEETFVNRDPQSALKLGHARGVALLSLARGGSLVAAYAPNLIKKSVVGAGHADKRQVMTMVRFILPKCDPQAMDAADALAVAITHAHHRRAPRAPTEPTAPMRAIGARRDARARLGDTP